MLFLGGVLSRWFTQLLDESGNWPKVDDPTGKRAFEDCMPQLWGAIESMFLDFDDLVALRIQSDHDRLSEFIQNNFGIFLSARTTPDQKTTAEKERRKQVMISHRKVSTLSNIVSLVLASALLSDAILSLSAIKTKGALLGAFCFWITLFAECMGLLTNAKRDQVFGATAAYAAVAVVFVSGNLSGGGDYRFREGCACPPVST